VLKRIAIDNFKCFSNFEFHPKNINLILGANGSGKSTFLQLVSDVAALIVDGRPVSDVFPKQSCTRWERRSLQTFEMDVELASGSYAYRLSVEDTRILSESVTTTEGKTLFAYEGGEVHLHKSDGRRGTSFPFGGHRTFLSEIEDRPESKELRKLLDYLAEVRLFRLDARNVASTSEQEDRYLRGNGENFASWYRHLAQEVPEQIDCLRDDLREVIPGFRTLKLEATGVRSTRQLTALLDASGSSYTVDFDELSDGQRGLVLLYTLLHGVKSSSALLLDEPEAHVGLSEIQPWLVGLDRTFESSGQVFLISHHPEVIDYMAASSAWWFERVDGAFTRQPRPLPVDLNCGLSASQQIARGF
jgi:predicted ATPase